MRTFGSFAVEDVKEPLLREEWLFLFHWGEEQLFAPER
jgi:hypothetical protein